MKIAIISIVLLFAPLLVFADTPITAEKILDRMDQNQNVERQILDTSMIIHSFRGSRHIKYKTWVIGEEKSFTESLAPAREKGTKMLKLADDLWIYYPRSDRVIRIAGHMLRQSMAGSDLSYEDMMEKSKLLEGYDATIDGDDVYDGRPVWVLKLQAKTPDISYQTRKIWVDKERFIGLKQELFAASGKLLKRLDVKEVFKTSKGWYPRKMVFKDVLKKGKGTELIVHAIDFDSKIPNSKFSKSALRR
jgi:outer membrane lipoprotein-sorting protein